MPAAASVIGPAGTAGSLSDTSLGGRRPRTERIAARSVLGSVIVGRGEGERCGEGACWVTDGDGATGNGRPGWDARWTTGSRAFADVQRQGLEATTRLVDRLIHAVDGDGRASPRVNGRNGAARPSEDVLRLWVEVVRLGLDAFGQFLPSVASNGGAAASVDVGSGTSTGVLRVEVGPRAMADNGEGRPGTELWLHNHDAAERSGLSLSCGDLRSSAGTTLPAEAVRFDPPTIDLPGRSSRGVLVSVHGDPAPGAYRGVILATGAGDVWLPIEVVVTGSSPDEGR